MEEFNKIKNNILYTLLELDDNNYNKLANNLKIVFGKNFGIDNIELFDKETIKIDNKYNKNNKELYKKCATNNCKLDYFLKIKNKIYTVLNELKVINLLPNRQINNNINFYFFDKINKKIKININYIAITDELILCIMLTDNNKNELSAYEKSEIKKILKNDNIYIFKADFEFESESKYIME